LSTSVKGKGIPSSRMFSPIVEVVCRLLVLNRRWGLWFEVDLPDSGARSDATLMRRNEDPYGRFVQRVESLTTGTQMAAELRSINFALKS
jgi:hypothetical protein